MQDYNASGAEAAAHNPEALILGSMETSDQTRSSGLILTKEQLKHLKRYEMAGLALPTELDKVIAYLAYETGAGRGLEATDFQKTFQLIHGHASQWNPLRTDLFSVSTKLVSFAGYMQVAGNTINDLFKDIKVLALIEQYDIRKVEDFHRIELEQGFKFPGIDDADRNDLRYFLDRILQNVREQETHTSSIKRRLDAFGMDLANRVIPEIKLKLATIDNNSLGSEIRALQAKIEARAKAIEEKNKEYKELVKQAIGGISSGLIMVIYVSVEAEKIRKERNKLSKQQEFDIALMETKNRILASLNRVRSDFQDLDLIVIDADIATKNLILVWNSISEFIAGSCAEVDLIDDGLSLRRFKNHFQQVVKPWEHIEKNANALLTVFEQADIEFREEYGVKP